MSHTRVAHNSLLGAMIALPLTYFFTAALPAASVPNTLFRPELALAAQDPLPDFEQIRKIDRIIIATYVTRKGDTLWQLAKRFKFSRENNETARSSNGLDFGVFSEGTVLKLPNHKGTLYTVTKPENIHAICQGYQLGRKLGVAYDLQVLGVNGFPVPILTEPEHLFASGTTLFLPEVYKPFGFPLPLPGRISSGFGRRRHPVLGITRQHKGIDIPKPYGTAVPASVRGVVTYAGWMGGYGNLVEIRSMRNRGGKSIVYFTRYGHLSFIAVHDGQSVKQSTLIGRVGSTGISTGPHLHFEVRDENGRAFDPR